MNRRIGVTGGYAGGDVYTATAREVPSAGNTKDGIIAGLLYSLYSCLILFSQYCAHKQISTGQIGGDRDVVHVADAQEGCNVRFVRLGG